MRPTVHGVTALLASLLFAGVAVAGVLAAVAVWRSGALGSLVPADLAPSAAPAPAIRITRTATPGELPIGGGHVDFTFVVTNPGNVVLVSVRVADLRCPDVTFSGGDANSNARLEPGETWRYACSGRLLVTTTDSATATAVFGTVLVRDSEETTIPVGFNRPAIHLESSVSPSVLAGGGGSATFSYVVTNVGNVPIAGLSVIDTACAPIGYGSGDVNQNGRLDLSETWRFSCTATISKTTTGNARVLGNVNGSGLHDDITETVTVSGTAPTTVTPTASASMTASAPAAHSPAIALDVRAQPPALPAGGGSVVFTYTVSNAGDVPLSSVSLADNVCQTIRRTAADANGNGMLDLAETWIFTCVTGVFASMTDQPMVTGMFDGQHIFASASTMVVVATATSSPTPSASPTPTPTATATPSQTPSTPPPSPTPSPTLASTPSPTRPVAVTAAPTAAPTVTATAMPSASETTGTTDHGSVAGVTSPPRASPGPGQTGTGQGGSTPSVPALILIVLIGVAATALILRLGDRTAIR